MPSASCGTKSIKSLASRISWAFTAGPGSRKILFETATATFDRDPETEEKRAARVRFFTTAPSNDARCIYDS